MSGTDDHEDDRAARALRESLAGRAAAFEPVLATVPRRRSRWLVPVGAAAAVAAVATAATWVLGPGTTTAPPVSPPSVSSPPEKGSPLLLTEDGEPLLRCQGQAVDFPPAALEGALDDLVPREQIVDMFRRATRGVVPAARVGTAPEDVEYVLLARYEEEGEPRLLVGFGPWPSTRDQPPGEAYAAERDERGWYLTRGGRCDLVPASSELLVSVLPPERTVASDGAVVSVAVTERDCTGGRDVRTSLREPWFEETADAVTVYWPADPPRGTAFTCQGNPTNDVELELPSPLGDRVLLDGSVWPPQQVLP